MTGLAFILILLLLLSIHNKVKNIDKSQQDNRRDPTLNELLQKRRMRK